MRIGDFCKTNLYAYSEKEKWNEIHYLDTGNITRGKVAEIQTLVPGIDTIPSRARRKVQVNDIIYSTVRPNQRHYGIIKASDPNMLVSTGFVVITVDTRIADPDFIYYFLTQDDVVETLEAIGEQSTSAYPSIKPSDIENLAIALPPLEVQKAAGAMLRQLDRKCAVNDEINDNLLQQAAALFAQYYEQASELVPFTSVIQILGGGTPKTGNPMFWNGDVPFFTPKDIGTPYTLTTEKTITEDGLAHCNSRLYPVNTVFVTARGTVGKVGLPGVPMAMNQSCYALIGKGIDQLMVYFYTLRTVQALKHKASGAVFDAITTRDFESETIRLIADDAAAEFLSVAAPMFGQILGNSIENQRLAELRDALLPRLMAGEIDVSDIDLSR